MAEGREYYKNIQICFINLIIFKSRGFFGSWRNFFNVNTEYTCIILVLAMPLKFKKKISRVVQDTDLAGYPANHFAGYRISS